MANFVGSFVSASEQVHTPDGTKTIGELRPNDVVLAWSETKNKLVKRRVYNFDNAETNAPLQDMYEVTWAGNPKPLRLTGKQYLWTKDGWRSVADASNRLEKDALVATIDDATKKLHWARVTNISGKVKAEVPCSIKLNGIGLKEYSDTMVVNGAIALNWDPSRPLPNGYSYSKEDAEVASRAKDGGQRYSKYLSFFGSLGLTALGQYGFVDSVSTAVIASTVFLSTIAVAHEWRFTRAAGEKYSAKTAVCTACGTGITGLLGGLMGGAWGHVAGDAVRFVAGAAVPLGMMTQEGIERPMQKAKSFLLGLKR
jgi:hypothetical protein